MTTVNGRNIAKAIRENVDRRARLMTDEASHYKRIGKKYAGGHHTVVHSAGEYVRGDVTTNSVEGFFSLIKRGMMGTFHAVLKKHLHRYVSGFEYKIQYSEIERWRSPGAGD